MYCNNCGSAVGENAAVCVNCGVAVPGAGARAQAGPTSRTSYILLGILLGLIGFPGIHNLYAGNQSRGLTQLLVTVLSCWILWLPIYIWTIVEACTVTEDFQGRPMS
jgi:TM2 domain-containing membrane protein YozV